MTVQRFKLVPGWIDTAGRTRTWRLVDATGRIRCEMTCKKDAGCVVEALNIADTLVANAAKVGIVIESAINHFPARYIEE
jgi:hypothetical protein